MTLKFSITKLVSFLVVLVLILALYPVYKESLFQKSHQIIKDAQGGHEPDSFAVKFATFFSDATDDLPYDLFVLMLSPFLSRERFWYYAACIQLACFAKLDLKMLLSEPRPVWVWPDLS